MDYFSNIVKSLVKVFPQTKSTATKAEESLNYAEAVGEYLRNLKKKGRNATIPDLCEKFKIDDDFKMAEIICDLESAGKALLDGFKPVYREDGGLIHLARYTGVVQ